MNIRAVFIASAALACAVALFSDARPGAARGQALPFTVAGDGQTLLLPVDGGVYPLGQTAATLTVVPQPSALNNPTTPSGNTGAQTFTVTVTASGLALLQRDGTEKVRVMVYAPPGTVTPTSRIVPLGPNNTATATFTYTGAYFSSPMTVAAALGRGSMTAPVFLANALPCTYGSSNAYEVAENDPLMFGKAGGFHIDMSVAGGETQGVQLDTGSTGFLIAASALKQSDRKQMIGPGQIGFETLEPSGITLIGHYYLAPVTLYPPGGSGSAIDTTIPMEILAVEFSCSPGKKCQGEYSSKHGGTALMGVGFGRPTPPPGQVYIKTPLENVFLQLQDVVEGNVHPGYILATDHLWLGLNQTNTANFPSSSFIQLQPFQGRPGDWQGPPGCLNFNGSGWQCGSLLVDIGIDSMIASGFNTPAPLTQINVASPTGNQPALQYGFPYPVPQSATPPAPDPNGISQGQAVEWLSGSGAPFVNVGRDAIAANDYLYDSACGLVGFGTPSQ